MKPFEVVRQTHILRFGEWMTRYAVMPLLLALGWVGALALFGSSDVLWWALSSAGRLALLAGSALALWVAPGMALIRLLWRDHNLSVIEHIGVAWGVGAALPPLLLLAMDIVNLPWNRTATVAYVALAAMIWLFTIWRQASGAGDERRNVPLRLSGSVTAVMVGFVVLALIARLSTTRNLLVGTNVDNYHHTLIVQLLVEHQGLFRSWEPYAPLVTFTYHYGFHASAAFLHWLTGIPATQAVLDIGQMMNAATLLAVFALAVRLTGSSVAGMWAALIVGFYNTLPAFLTFWGRNPFVTSHVVLAAVLIVWMAAIETERRDWRLIALAAIVSAGLALCHYQTTIMAAPTILVYLLVIRLHSPPGAILATMGRVVAIGTGAGLLILPWMLNVSSGHLDRNVAHVTRPAAAAGQILAAAVPAVAPLYLKGPVIVAAIGGMLVAGRRRLWRALLPAGWTLALLATAMPHVIGLPGTGVVQGEIAAMTLYLMAAPLAGITLAAVCAALERVASRLTFVPIAALIIASAWGVGWQRDLVPDYMRMVMPADVQAMAWVREHTPPDARFVVNSHPIYGGDMIVGVDAGWWIPFFTGRRTNVPPMAYGSELAADPQYAAEIHALARDLRRRPLTDGQGVLVDLTLPETIERLRTAGYTYVYSGAQPIAGPGGIPAPDRIDTARLRTSPHFRLVYNHDGVEIFELVTQ
jgi:hypothetical protein